uniref:Uncharacterized protein n=1 Tax=Acrobeloides nanus TaxID=290746 RepID=A0A914E678_9BILA
MGGIFSTLGFNQPFFFTLVGIILLLVVTTALVADSAEDSKPDINFETGTKYHSHLRVNIRTPLDKLTSRSREYKPINIY